MPAAEKAENFPFFQEMLPGLPKRLPPEHLDLMNANRDRIFAAIDQAQAKQ